MIDTDGDGLADRVYAGDLVGNMWAFDLSGSTTSSWDVAYMSGSTPKPLFDAPANQQVTTTPVIVRNSEIPTSSSTAPNTLVIFGTGQYLTAGDITTTDTQAMYGVWDSGTDEITQSELVAQTIGTGTTPAGVAVRTLTDVDVSYASKYGWYMNLPTSGERVITDAVIRDDLVFFNTTTPDTNPCNFGGTGWLMVAKWINGGRPDQVAFDTNNDSLLDMKDEVSQRCRGRRPDNRYRDVAGESVEQALHIDDANHGWQHDRRDRDHRSGRPQDRPAVLGRAYAVRQR